MSLREKFEVLLPPQDIELYTGCLHKIAAGDQHAYDWLYKNYSRRIYDYALLLTQDTGLSEDIVQDVFLKLWVNRTSLNDVENFNAYFFQTGRNCVLQKKREEHREDVYLHEYARRNHQTFHLEDAYSLKESETILHEAVNALSQQQQQVYRLNQAGIKREGIAKELNVAPNTVKTHLQRALSAIRKYFNQKNNHTI